MDVKDQSGPSLLKLRDASEQKKGLLWAKSAMLAKSDNSHREKMDSGDPFDLERFVEAQGGVYDRVCEELRGGRKESHWMWFIFPQLKGLGHSPMAQKYGISSLHEAEAYLKHIILGARLRKCTELVLKIEGRSMSRFLAHPMI